MNASKVDASVERLMQAAHVTGVGIARFHLGKIEYLKAYGSRDVQNTAPLTSSSVMTSASLSKNAFATVVMRLVQRHRIELDRPVYKYLPKPLPDYPNYADLSGDERYKLLTLRMLLSHTSGFANWRRFEDDKKLRIHFQPGTRYAYSGEGIDLAQFVVEAVTHTSLTELMSQELFRPLHMVRSSMVWESRFEDDFANGYDEAGLSLGPQKRKRPEAAGSMQTTLNDYAVFVSSLMQGDVLDARTRELMFSPQIRIHSAHQFPSLALQTTTDNDAISLSYGLGWGLYSSPHGKALFKEGHDDGWRHLVLCFSNGDGLLIMTNSSNGEAIFKPLLDELLGATSFPLKWEGYATGL